MSEKKIDTAADLVPGEKASIVKVSGKAHLKRRLLDMGVVAGSSIEMVRHAPLGDPIDVKIKGYHLSLRKSEARYITVKRHR
jgi:Fe2+ transport system protein FeoA